MDKIFGGSIVTTLLTLVFLSFVVGLLFAMFGIDPIDLWRNFGETFQRVWQFFGDTIQWGFKYAVVGAIVVLPLWILYRLLLAFTTQKKS